MKNKPLDDAEIDRLFLMLKEACDRMPILTLALDDAMKFYADSGRDFFGSVLDVMLAMDLHDAGQAPDWFVEDCE